MITLNLQYFGGRGSNGSRNSGDRVSFSVEDYSIWGTEVLTSYENYNNPEGIESAVEEMKKSVQEALEMADYDVDRAWEYLADYYPFNEYGDEAVKVINNRDEHNILAVRVDMLERNGKVQVTLTPRELDESDYYSREELDAMGLYERRR